jgi:response regulator RpfG family c-di-GMP phosphodiesterase
MTQTTTFENTVTHPLRVFLVEDSLDVRELMIENLTMIPGVVVAGVSESEGDALNQLNALPCDVLIVDIQSKSRECAENYLQQ